MDAFLVCSIAVAVVFLVTVWVTNPTRRRADRATWHKRPPS